MRSDANITCFLFVAQCFYVFFSYLRISCRFYLEAENNPQTVEQIRTSRTSRTDRVDLGRTSAATGPNSWRRSGPSC